MENMCDSISAKKKIHQFIKFALVGVSNTVISEGVYAILIFFRMHYLPASFIGFSLSVINAYYWNSKYVFREREEGEKRVWWKTLCKTYLAYLGGYLANAGLLILWIDVLRIERLMYPLSARLGEMGFKRLDAEFLGGITAAFINVLLTVPINFLVNKYWAFRQKDREG